MKVGETPSERVKRKLLVENLWYYILKLLKKNRMYGFEIRDRINREFGFWIGNVTAYKVLYDLERGGYVRAEHVSYKKHYAITAKGKRELGITDKFLKKLIR